MMRALVIFVACLCAGCAFVFSTIADLFDTLDTVATGAFEVLNAIANPDAEGEDDDSDDEPRTPGGGKRKPAHA